MADQKNVYYLLYKLDEPATIPIEIDLRYHHKKNKSYDKASTRFPNLRYSYQTILKSNNTKYHLDHSAIHSLLLFMQTLPITLTNFIELFKNKYSPLKGSNYKEILTCIKIINQAVVKDPIRLLNDTYTYQKAESMPDVKRRLVFTKQTTAYLNEAEEILDAILVCITGYKRIDMCKYIEDYDKTYIDKIGKHIKKYIKILSEYTNLIPLIRVHINKALNGNEIQQRFVPIVYDFQIFDIIEQKTYNFDIFRANEKRKEKSENHDLHLSESDGNYIPLRLFYSKEIRQLPAFLGVELNEDKISKLNKDAKNKQLDKKYLTL